MEKIRIRLKEYRTEKNYTQQQIADILGMKYQEYQKIENGKTASIRVDKLHSMCVKLGVSADWLMGMSKEQKIKPEVKIEEW